MRSRPSFLAIPAAILAAGIASAAPASAGSVGDWTQYQSNAQHTGTADLAPAPPLKVAWERPTGIGDETHIAGLPAPVIVDGNAIIVDREDVSAVEVSTGNVSWKIPRALGPSAPAAVATGDGGRTMILYTEGGGDRSGSTSGSPAPSPTASSGTVSPAALAQDSTLVAVDAATQRELWRRPLPDVSTTGPTVDGGIAVVGTNDGSVTAIDLSTGVVAWHQDLGDIVDSPIAADAGVVFVSVRSSTRPPPSVVALRGTDGSEVWRYTPTTSGLLVGSPAVVDGTLYVSLSDATVRAIETDTGVQRWAAKLNAAAEGGAPAVASGAVIVADSRGEVYRLDPATGERTWDFALNTAVYGSPVITDHAVLVADGSGELSALDPTDGDRIWRLSIGTGPLLTVAVATDTVIVSRTGAAAGLVGLVTDPDGVLVDEQSPTIVMPASIALDWAAAAIPIVVVLLLAGRFLAGRLGPAVFEDEGEGSDAVDAWEDDGSPT